MEIACDSQQNEWSYLMNDTMNKYMLYEWLKYEINKFQFVRFFVHAFQFQPQKKVDYWCGSKCARKLHFSFKFIYGLWNYRKEQKKRVEHTEWRMAFRKKNSSTKRAHLFIFQEQFIEFIKTHLLYVLPINAMTHTGKENQLFEIKRKRGKNNRLKWILQKVCNERKRQTKLHRLISFELFMFFYGIGVLRKNRIICSTNVIEFFLSLR